MMAYAHRSQEYLLLIYIAISCAACCFTTAETLAPLPKLEAPKQAEITHAITKGVDYLVQKQNADGSWGGPRRTKGLNIYAPVPDAHLAFRSGASALALRGLLDAKDERDEVKVAIAKSENWFLTKFKKLRHINPSAMYNVWGHAYGLKAISGLYQYNLKLGNEKRCQELKSLAELQVKMLLKIEQLNGGWGYYDFKFYTAHVSGTPTSFTTATVLLALKEAEKIMGIELPDRQVQRGLDSIEKQRTADWSFVYSFRHQYRPRYSINRPAGSLARSQACLVALRNYDDKRITDELLAHWLHRLCLREGWLSIARKRPIPHDIHFAISGYFYYYGFYYATDSLQQLPPTEQKKFSPYIAQHLLSKQERDGSWWDYPLYDYHQAYGTGFALTSLSRLVMRDETP